MSILILAEHDNKPLKPATLNTVTAATQIGADVHLLAVGFECQTVVEQASQVAGVSKVLVADNAVYEHQLAENVSKLVVDSSRWLRSYLSASACNHNREKYLATCGGAFKRGAVV